MTGERAESGSHSCMLSSQRSCQRRLGRCSRLVTASTMSVLGTAQQRLHSTAEGMLPLKLKGDAVWTT
eukprot:579336-Rhodomonas_salina.1